MILIFSKQLEDSNGCVREYLEIRDGGNEHDEKVGKYCGSGSPGQLISHGSQLYMKFVSNTSVPSIGFKASYEGMTSSFLQPKYR